MNSSRGRRGGVQNINYTYRQTLPACAHSRYFVLCLRGVIQRVLNLLKEIGVVPNTISYDNTISYNIVFENLERMEMQ